MNNNIRDIHKAGRRPTQRPQAFYDKLLIQYETMTTREMAKIHGVTPKTICNWLKIARQRRDNDDTKEKTTA